MVAEVRELEFEQFMKTKQRKIQAWERSRSKISELLPGTLYIGGYPDDAHLLAQMSEVKVSLLISATRRNPKPIENVEILRIPFEDSPYAPPTPVLKSIARYTAEWVAEEKGPVMVHCAYGLNRSALLAGFIMKELTDWTGDEILKAIQKRRHGSLHNKRYRDIVRAL